MLSMWPRGWVLWHQMVTSTDVGVPPPQPLPIPLFKVLYTLQTEPTVFQAAGGLVAWDHTHTSVGSCQLFCSAVVSGAQTLLLLGVEASRLRGTARCFKLSLGFPATL